jgi:hypothetical protein
MEKQLQVRVETVYGVNRVYPVNDQAKKLATLLGTKTFTPYHMKNAAAMGFNFVTSQSLAELQALQSVL